jgi:ribonuclease D
VNLEKFWRSVSSSYCVFHSARQDLEILFQTANILPKKIFDTQIAASILGYPHQISYKLLVEKLCGKKLKKAHTRANWEKRPLTNEMIEYAAEDVQFLLEIHSKLYKKLQEQDRLKWAEEDFEKLNSKNLYRVNKETIPNKLKSPSSMHGHEKRTFKLFSEWRELEAMKKNLPRKWIIKDKTIIEIIKKRIRKKSELNDIKSISKTVIEEHGTQILKIMENISDTKKIDSGTIRVNEKQKKDVLEAQNEIKIISKNLGVVPELIATKKEIKNFILGEENVRFMHGWRYEIFGKRLLELIN